MHAYKVTSHMISCHGVLIAAKGTASNYIILPEISTKSNEEKENGNSNKGLRYSFQLNKKKTIPT